MRVEIPRNRGLTYSDPPLYKQPQYSGQFERIFNAVFGMNPQGDLSAGSIQMGAESTTGSRS